MYSDMVEYKQKLREAATGLWEQTVKSLKAEIRQRLVVLQEVVVKKVWIVEIHQQILRRLWVYNRAIHHGIRVIRFQWWRQRIKIPVLFYERRRKKKEVQSVVIAV